MVGRRKNNYNNTNDNNIQLALQLYTRMGMRKLLIIRVHITNSYWLIRLGFIYLFLINAIYTHRPYNMYIGTTTITTTIVVVVVVVVE